ncbi:MAG: phosphoribosylformylglycinamidine synthase subunit PurQ [Leptospirillia bacterium]
MPDCFRIGIIRFPGTNCDLDTWEAVALVPGLAPTWISHRDRSLDGIDAVILPGGFSYGDYLRTGIIAARSPVMDAVGQFAEKGHPVLGICNGFQILAEAGLLPGTLLQNSGRTFLCREEGISVEQTRTPFTLFFSPGARIRLPIAHQEGRFHADPDTLVELEAKGQVLCRYNANPNGSLRDIAGVTNAEGTIAGLMPHPERRMRGASTTDGLPFFQSLAAWLSGERDISPLSLAFSSRDDA